VRCSVTAGTIFDRTRTPLTLWFTACWLFATGKDGIAALSLKRSLDVGSYQTVWAMLHRLRAVLVRPGRERLVGTVEVDETDIGGRDPGVGRGKGRGDKVLTGIAVEIKEPCGYGRCRLAPLADASAASLRAFVSDHVEPGATVITDGWKGNLGLDRCGYTHEARSQRAARLRGDEQAAELLPAVHRVALPVSPVKWRALGIPMRAPGPMRVGAADLQAGKGWRSWRRMLLAPVRARCAQASRGGPKRGCAFVTGPRHIVAALPSPPISAPHG
jgi:hypothetical protein